MLSAELWSLQGVSLARNAYRRLGRRGLLSFGGATLTSARDWLEATFASDAARGLLAPWVLHTGLGPEQAMAGFMTQVIGCAIQLGGMPVPRGGGIRLVEALAAIVREAGGELRTDADVERVLVSGGRATGVRLVGGETVTATRAVIASVTPTQLYGKPARPRRRARSRSRARPRRFRYGRGRHADPLRAERAARVGVERGLAPLADRDRARHARASTASRAPSTRPSGAASGRGDDRRRPAVCGRSGPRARRQLDPLDPAAGAAAGAARRCARHHRRGRRDVDGRAPRGVRRPDRRAARRGRSATSSERRSSASCSRRPTSRRSNCNLVGGDIYAGSCALDQNLLWRPTGRASRACDRGRRALAHRRLDASGAGARPGLGLSRREAADPSAAAPAHGRRVPVALGKLRGGCRCEALAERDLDGRRVVRRGRRRVLRSRASTGSGSGSSSSRTTTRRTSALLREAGSG